MISHRPLYSLAWREDHDSEVMQTIDGQLKMLNLKHLNLSLDKLNPNLKILQAKNSNSRNHLKNLCCHQAGYHVVQGEILMAAQQVNCGCCDCTAYSNEVAWRPIDFRCLEDFEVFRARRGLSIRLVIHFKKPFWDFEADTGLAQRTCLHSRPLSQDVIWMLLCQGSQSIQQFLGAETQINMVTFQSKYTLYILISFLFCLYCVLTTSTAEGSQEWNLTSSYSFASAPSWSLWVLQLNSCGWWHMRHVYCYVCELAWTHLGLLAGKAASHAPCTTAGFAWWAIHKAWSGTDTVLYMLTASFSVCAQRWTQNTFMCCNRQWSACSWAILPWASWRCNVKADKYETTKCCSLRWPYATNDQHLMAKNNQHLVAMLR